MVGMVIGADLPVLVFQCWIGWPDSLQYSDSGGTAFTLAMVAGVMLGIWLAQQLDLIDTPQHRRAHLSWRHLLAIFVIMLSISVVGLATLLTVEMVVRQLTAGMVPEPLLHPTALVLAAAVGPILGAFSGAWLARRLGFPLPGAVALPLRVQSPEAEGIQLADRP